MLVQHEDIIIGDIGEMPGQGAAFGDSVSHQIFAPRSAAESVGRLRHRYFA